MWFRPALSLAVLLTGLLLALGYFSGCVVAEGNHALSVSRGEGELRVTYWFEPPVVEPGSVSGYHVVRVPGLKLEGVPGKPLVPVRRSAVLVPAGQKVVDVMVLPGTKRVLGYYTIEPASEPVPISARVGTSAPVPDWRVYQSGRPYPARPASEASLQYKSGCPIVLSNLYPIEYVPTSGQVSYYESLTVVVRLEPQGETVSGPRFAPSSIDKMLIERMVDNPEELAGYQSQEPSVGRSKLLTGEYHHVIITARSLVQAFTPLAEWRRATGLTSAVVAVEDIYAAYAGRDPQEKIRNFIQDAKAQNGIVFVLLGGDGDGANVGGESGDPVVPVRGLFAPDVDECPIEVAARSQESEEPESIIETMRHFRDRCLDPQFVDMYYRHSRTVKWALLTNPSLLRQAAGLLVKYAPSVRDASRGGTGGILMTEADVKELTGFLGALRREVLEQESGQVTQGIGELVRELERLEGYVAGTVGKTFGAAFWGSPYAAGAAASASAAAIQEDPEAIAGDLYYACLDGSYDGDGDGVYGEPTDGEQGGDVDLLAEVYVGRAPVDSEAEATAFVAKILAYEKTALSEGRLRVAWMLGEKLDEDTYGADYKEEVRNGSSNHDYSTAGFPPVFSVGTLYDRPDWEWPKEAAIEILNGGPHLLNHIGHGNINYVMRMKNEDVDQLRNGTAPFFLYTQACYAGSFDNCDAENAYREFDCVAEHLTAGPAGAFGVVANSRYGYYRSGSTDGWSQRFDREFWDAVFGEGLPWLGVALQDSKEDNAGSVSEENVMRFCYYELNLLGDPPTYILVPGMAPPDVISPVVAATDPRDGASGVPVNTAIAVTFSEEVEAGPEFGQITLKDQAGRSLEINSVISGSVLTIKPSVGLDYDTGYSVTIPAGAVMDKAGNLLRLAYSFGFTTESKVVFALPATITAVPGALTTTSVAVHSAQRVAGFQFTLTWDAPWLTDPYAEKGNLISGDANWNLSFQAGPGSVQVMGYSATGQALGAAEGELVRLGFRVATDGPPGATVELRFAAVTVSDAEARSIPASGVNGCITLAGRAKGDANGDGAVNVLDVVRTVNIALGRIQPTDEEKYAADANGDGVINVLDVVRIVNIALGRT